MNSRSDELRSVADTVENTISENDTDTRTPEIKFLTCEPNQNISKQLEEIRDQC